MYIYAPNYIKKLNGNEALQANKVYEKLLVEWGQREIRLAAEERERKRLEYLEGQERKRLNCLEEQERKRLKRLEEKKLKKEKIKHILDLFATHNVKSLWYMAHWQNIRSILHLGILNHYEARDKCPDLIDISDPRAQYWREYNEPVYNRKIHCYVPLYINPFNPMLYIRRNQIEQICLIEVMLNVLFDVDFLISDGNAASRGTCFHNSIDALAELSWEALEARYWTDIPDGKRKRCAEVLIYPTVSPALFKDLYCFSDVTRRNIDDYGKHINVIKYPF